MKKLHDAGNGINGTFVFGTDGDDRSVFERTVEMVQKLRIDLPRYAVMTPFPGTTLFRELAGAGRIIEKDWAMYDVEHCVIKPLRIRPEALEQGLEWAWRETYRTPAIARRIAGLSRRCLLDVPLNIGYRMYANKLPRFDRATMTDNSDIPL